MVILDHNDITSFWGSSFSEFVLCPFQNQEPLELYADSAAVCPGAEGQSEQEKVGI